MWRAPSSVRRYDKAGRLALAMRKLSNAQRDNCERWAAAAPKLCGNAYGLPFAPAALENVGPSSTSFQASAASPQN